MWEIEQVHRALSPPGDISQVHYDPRPGGRHDGAADLNKSAYRASKRPLWQSVYMLLYLWTAMAYNQSEAVCSREA